MGTMSQKIKDMQSKRIAYQKEKTKGFVRVPEEERLRQRIDAYPYLIP